MCFSAPLYESLIRYVKKGTVPFHMPGHRQGKAFPDFFRSDVFAMDLTEIPGTDNLHQPEGPVKEAQELAAAAFGAKETFFLVNGSTCGIQAMISAVCNPGDTLIVDRNCHGAVVSAMILCGVVPKYIYPEYVEALGIVGGIKPEKVEEMLIDYYEAKGVIITSPNYYGICSNIGAIAAIVHRHGKVLMVDEAHGAHFCFHENLPPGALAQGADICVQSAHKTLPALTQSSMLHIGSHRIDRTRVRSSLRLFQSSSPSFILMAYLDAARAIMEREGHYRLENMLCHIQKMREYINSESIGYCIGTELEGSHGIHRIDTGRVVVNFADAGANGHRVAERINLKFNIQIEMADIYNIIGIVSIGSGEEELKLLGQAVAEAISQTSPSQRAVKGPVGYVVSQPLLSPREAFYSDSEIIPVSQAKGRICCDNVVSFPPGVPVLCPGEAITEDVMEYLRKVRESGGGIVGLTDGDKVRVVNFNS